jgi:hypothetical protein
MTTTMLTLIHSLRDRAHIERKKWAYRDCYTRGHENMDLETHLREAVNWLRRAQDHGDDRGFSYGTRFGSGFHPSYPETTGYIIPTLLRLAESWGDASLVERAIAAGDWEIDLQMGCGAVMAGKTCDDPSPAVFNTGQVLFGWMALYRKTGDVRYLDAARRAADWLMEVQEPAGNWVRGNSRLAASRSTLYNVRAAWGLAVFGAQGDSPPHLQAALRNADYTLRCQQENGWYADCCLSNPQRPLLHTLAYTMQGMLEIGRLAGREEIWMSAEPCARSLVALAGRDGFLPGRIDSEFNGAVDWCCLTGSAQTSIVLSRLHFITGEPAFAETARRINRYLMARHDLDSVDPAIRGGMAGSWPLWGEYCPFSVINWAAKFFIDALLEEGAGDEPRWAG